MGDGKTMYMFDYGNTSTVPWNLAVFSARAALFIARLDEKMAEDVVAWELVQEGIPFHTLQ